MKLKKYLAMMLLAGAVSYTFTACSDDDTLGDAPRMFRPVAALTVEQNRIIVDWENIKGATNYDLELYKVVGTDETTGESIYEETPCATGTCTEAPYTFSDLDWDERYIVRISCSGGDKSSEPYETTEASITYLSKLTGIRAIDNSVRITWDQGGSVIKVFKIEEGEKVTEDSNTPAETAVGDVRLVEVSDEDYAAGTIDIVGLNPETEYTFTAYSDADVQNNSTYAGKQAIETTAPEDFEAMFGGNYLDIRNYDDEQAADTLKTKEFWAQVKDGMTIILRGDFEYKVSSDIKFDKSVGFMTGATLGGNARFISSGGMQCAKGATVGSVTFNNVDFYSDKAIPGGGYEVATTNNKGFGGRQVFNENGTESTLGSLLFQGCHFEGYRAVVRLQADNDNVQNVTFDNCTFNGIGDQGVITTNNKKADMQNVTLKNSTVMNVVMFADFRASANPMNVNVENCTFCYAPLETNANANTPLFRFGSNDVTLTVTASLFGPSMASEDSKGGNIITYTAGTVGSIFLNASKATVNASKSFKTDFGWWADDKGTTYPIDGLQDLGMSETELWQSPSTGDFKVIGNVGEAGIGDPRWGM